MSETSCPTPVASAAPAITIFGKNASPKISIGSRMMFVTQPPSRAIMDTFIRPTAWKIFSKASPAMMIGENRNAIDA